VRIAWGYNAFGFTGRDRAALGYMQHGAYLDLGVKFHEFALRTGEVRENTSD
jgi:hypothetical protein